MAKIFCITNQKGIRYLSRLFTVLLNTYLGKATDSGGRKNE
jgi:hypothetical protein